MMSSRTSPDSLGAPLGSGTQGKPNPDSTSGAALCYYFKVPQGFREEYSGGER